VKEVPAGVSGLIGDFVGNVMKFVDGLPSYMRPNPAFRSRKAAQACAFFAAKAVKGMDKLKIVKLLYLAERVHLASYHAGLVWDDLFSLKNGPVPSSSLNGIDGNIHPEVWDEYLGKHGNKRFAARQLLRDDFDELSNAELITPTENAPSTLKRTVAGCQSATRTYLWQLEFRKMRPCK
jgi:hypothetical protein